MIEDQDTRLRRMRMRSWRRGMKEMDLILGRFADDALAGLTPDQLDDFDRLLAENDQDLYLWVTARINPGPGKPAGPDDLGPLLDVIASHASAALAKG